MAAVAMSRFLRQELFWKIFKWQTVTTLYYIAKVKTV
jgi:hypothetical protein